LLTLAVDGTAYDGSANLLAVTPTTEGITINGVRFLKDETKYFDTLIPLVEQAVNGGRLTASIASGSAEDASVVAALEKTYSGAVAPPEKGDNQPFTPSNDPLYGVVTFELNGGTAIPGESRYLQNVRLGAHVVRPWDPILEGSILKGWADEQGNDWRFGYRNLVTKTLTLTANWVDADTGEATPSAPPLEVSFSSAVADGSTGTANDTSSGVTVEGYAKTTKVTLTFDQDVPGLAVGNVTLTANGTGAVKGSLTRTATGVYDLTLTGITSAGEITVAVSKPNTTFTPNSKTANVSVAMVANPLYLGVVGSLSGLPTGEEATGAFIDVNGDGNGHEWVFNVNHAIEVDSIGSAIIKQIAWDTGSTPNANMDGSTLTLTFVGGAVADTITWGETTIIATNAGTLYNSGVANWDQSIINALNSLIAPGVTATVSMEGDGLDTVVSGLTGDLFIDSGNVIGTTPHVLLAS
jgi:hypothetical protein